MARVVLRIGAMIVLRIVVIAAFATAAWAQEEGSGFTLEMTMDGTANALGTIMRFDPTAGYRINRYVAIEAGIPTYYVKPSETALPYLSAASGGGLGNAHAALRLNFDSTAVTYRPSFTVTAPTGSEERGLSTGQVTWDWNNLIQRTFGRITPYASIGVANTISDSPFFLRPFTTNGFVSHFEGGALASLSRYVSVGASAYAYEPSGEQTVISRVAAGDETTTPPTVEPPAVEPPATPVTPGNSQRGRDRGNKPPAVWETAPETIGSAEIARDRGASVWMSVAPSPVVSFYAGYSRSTTYALNTVFFGVGINVGAVIKNRVF